MSPFLADEDQQNWNFYNNPRHPYDEFFPTYIGKPLKFEFVKRHYNRSLAELAAELPGLPLRMTTVFGPRKEGWFAESVDCIEKAGYQTLYDFLPEVSTRAQAEVFLGLTRLPQPNLMGLMDYLKQWWFPYPATLRQLVEGGDPILEKVLNQLKSLKIANSFSMLEAGSQSDERKKLLVETGIPEPLLLDLVHRADVSRLPYTSGGAVKRLWAMGYTCLADLRKADPADYSKKIEAYFTAGGKGSPFDSRMEQIIAFLQNACHAPEVVEED